MAGSWFKEGIDRVFLHNRGYDYGTGQWDSRGVKQGIGQTLLGLVNPALGFAGGKVMDHYNRGYMPQGYQSPFSQGSTSSFGNWGNGYSNPFDGSSYGPASTGGFMGGYQSGGIFGPPPPESSVWNPGVVQSTEAYQPPVRVGGPAQAHGGGSGGGGYAGGNGFNSGGFNAGFSVGQKGTSGTIGGWSQASPGQNGATGNNGNRPEGYFNVL